MGSSFPAEISLLIDAPSSTHSLITLDLKLSIEILQFGNDLIISLTIGVIRFSSSFSETKLAPGFELYAPMSIKSAPSTNIFSACFKMLFSSLNLPPS